MKITFFDTNIEVCNALAKEFSEFDEIDVCCQSLNEMKGHDCLVTAGNSYGIMNGGIDLSVREMMGIEFQDALQWHIVTHYGGKLPVGCNLVLECSRRKFKKVIYAPTMERPQKIVPNDIFVVFYNILKTFMSLNANSLACCGLGTGVGCISAKDHSKMLKESYILFRKANTQDT